jgi:hypothetical protein
MPYFSLHFKYLQRFAKFIASDGSHLNEDEIFEYEKTSINSDLI